jgi:predicted nucleotidyltransferase
LANEILEMLGCFQQVLQQFGIDFYVVGAIARDIGFSANSLIPARRKTKDVDIAIMIADQNQFFAVKDALLATGDFTAHETEVIKLFYKQRIELDLLPFGEIENECRETKIDKPRPFVLNMPGFLEVFTDAKEIQLSGGARLKYCSLDGLILLKLFAYDDNPMRTKDAMDIDYIIEVYFDLNDDLIYEAHLDVFDLYDIDNSVYLHLVSARVIGRKIKTFFSPGDPLLHRVNTIARKRPDQIWQALADGMEE